MSSLNLTSLSLEKKIGQLFFVGIPDIEYRSETESLLNEILPGGVCIFSRNVKGAEQIRSLLDDIRDTAEILPFLSVDQEGGLVDRLRKILTPMPAPNRIRSPADAFALGSLAGEALRLLGFNMDFAPVVDVVDGERVEVNNGLQSRIFGKDAREVSILATEFIRGLSSHGILGCLKHFPGLGGSSVDSHEELPIVGSTIEQLNDIDLLPYRSLIDTFETICVMVGHATYPVAGLQDVDTNGRILPSSLSFSVVSKLLRDELEFSGMVLTDDLEMGAIVKNFGIGEACKLAVMAGQDMLAICAEPAAIREGFASIKRAVNEGEIEESRIDRSLEKIERLKSKIPEPIELDLERLSKISDEIADLRSNLG